MTSSTPVGATLKTRPRSRKSIDRAPRSMVRDRAPVRLDWWKSIDNDRAWAKVSTAARFWAACATGVNTASRAWGAAAEMKRISAQPPARPAKAQVTAATALCPADSWLTALPSISGASTPSALPARVRAKATVTRHFSPGASERSTSCTRSPMARQKRTG